MRLPRAWLATILATTTASAILMGAQSVPPPGRLPLLPRGDFLRPVVIGYRGPGGAARVWNTGKGMGVGARSIATKMA